MGGITVKDFSFSYADSKEPVLNGINLFAKAGEVTLIYGPTGGGKTTLLKAITGLLDIEGAKGKIEFQGETRSSSFGFDSRVAYVSQCPENQVFKQTVKEEILFGMENVEVPKDAALKHLDGSLKRIGLSGNERMDALSGGKRALAVIESILALNREVIVLDEPLANLDITASLKMLKRLKELAKEGKTIILCEHRLQLCLPFVDTVYRLLDGKATKLNGGVPLRPQSETLPDEERIPGSSVLKGENITIGFGENKVLNGVDIDIRSGERIVIIGPNGSGKTTLLESLSGLMKLKRKQGKLISDFGRIGSRKWNRSISFVFQNPTHQMFSWTVKEEIQSGNDPNLSLKLMEELQLKSLSDRQPLSLSEGEKRRVAIASALAKNPKIIFLDEPTVGQDPKSLSLVVSALNRAAKEHKTSLITVTHDLDTALSLMDRAYLLEAGVLVEMKDKSEVKEYFSSLFEMANAKAEDTDL